MAFYPVTQTPAAVWVPRKAVRSLWLRTSTLPGGGGGPTKGVFVAQSVRIFFTTNRQTCVEWLTRIRAAVITVALSAGQPHVALRHSHKLLKELLENNNFQVGLREGGGEA